ncbi:ABC transporter substrate-binding protein [Mariniluteicoccus endophyticus]
MTSRRTFLALAAAAGIGGLAACQAGQTPTPTGAAGGRTTIGLSYIPNIQFAPFYTAEAQGLFSKAGVDATLHHHGANEGLFTALSAGQEEFVIAGGDEMLQAREQGMDLVALATYYRAYPVTVIVKDDSPIRTAADLAGRTVGIPGRYGETFFGLQVALAGAGLDESKVKVQEIGYTQQAALTTGKVDAVVGFSNNDAVQFQLAGVGVRQVPLADEVPLVSIVLVTQRKTLDTKKDLAKKVADAMVGGMKAVVADPAKAIEDAKKHVPTLAQEQQRTAARATLDATIPLWAPGGTVDGSVDAEQWKKMSAFLAEKELTKVPVPAESAIALDVVTA